MIAGRNGYHTFITRRCRQVVQRIEGTAHFVSPGFLKHFLLEKQPASVLSAQLHRTCYGGTVQLAGDYLLRSLEISKGYKGGIVHKLDTVQLVQTKNGFSAKNALKPLKISTS